MQFHRGLPVNPPVPTMHLLKLPLGKAYAAVLSPSQGQWVTVSLHYCTEAERRVMCEGKKCRCRGIGKGWAVEDRVYVPCQAVQLCNVGGTFELPRQYHLVECLIGFTEHAMPCLYDAQPGETVCIKRMGTKKNGPVVAHRFEHQLPALPWREEYPVVQTLSKVFGIRA